VYCHIIFLGLGPVTTKHIKALRRQAADEREIHRINPDSPSSRYFEDEAFCGTKKKTKEFNW